MIDIAVINNKVSGAGEFMAMSEAGERALLHAIGRKDDDNLQGDGMRYTLDMPEKALLCEILIGTDIVVDGDINKTYHYVPKEDRDRVERENQLAKEGRGAVRDWRTNPEEDIRYPFLVNMGSSAERTCVLRVGYVLSCDIALCHCTKSKGGICKSHNQRVFICINCDAVYAEDYVHSKLQFQLPVICTS